jgi:TatA/E family protein of Tat protein translocase
MFGTMGISELIIILVIVLIIFGAGKLPQIGEGVGKALRGFKKEVNDIPLADAVPPEANQPAPIQVQSTFQADRQRDYAGTDSRRSEAHGTLYAWAGTDSRDYCRLDAQDGCSSTAG